MPIYALLIMSREKAPVLRNRDFAFPAKKNTPSPSTTRICGSVGANRLGTRLSEKRNIFIFQFFLKNRTDSVNLQFCKPPGKFFAVFFRKVTIFPKPTVEVVNI
jgi:hypothetical protein